MAHLIGREAEVIFIEALLSASKNLLLEGAVGVGKTFLLTEILNQKKINFHRIDGDSRFSEQKLVGSFDPPLVIEQGYSAETFIDGPLTLAMKHGEILFINELNRLPEGVQNVLLPALDERKIQIPRLGEVQAKKGFLVIATQNPKEFVATAHLSEALLDRFELITVSYQSEEEEMKIVQNAVHLKSDHPLIATSVQVVRATRTHPNIKRGASVRAAISIAEITKALIDRGMNEVTAFEKASQMALATRVEWESDFSENGTAKERSSIQIITDLVNETANGKKKP